MFAESGVSLGQYTSAGRKPVNQDFHGAGVSPLKGVALAIADGIGSSPVGHLASAIAVSGFLEDYYATPASWSVKRSAERVIRSLNDWLSAQPRQGGDQDLGHVTTFTALIVQAAAVHLFHVGDARVYRFRAGLLEPLTREHRLTVTPEKSYLSRALGVEPGVEIDYRRIGIEAGDLFLLATDGVYQYLRAGELRETLSRAGNDLDQTARNIAEQALAHGSPDNVTVQIARIERKAKAMPGDWLELLSEPLPPSLHEGMRFDGFTLIRALHVSHRSQVFLALDEDRQTRVVLKAPAIDGREDPGYLERFVLEDWIIAQVDHPHVIKSECGNRPRRFLYTVFEYIEGQTLRQWRLDRRESDFDTVIALLGQLGLGLQALHRLDIVHRDIRPDNVLITGDGQVKIIDFGSARAAGIEDGDFLFQRRELPGDLAYSAPELLFGEAGGPAADIFSLGVIAYQLLSGGVLPYGAEAGRARTPAALGNLVYRPLSGHGRAVPVWLDAAIRKAVAPEPSRRYREVAEFLYELTHPNPRYLNTPKLPLVERNSVAFWQTTSALLAITVIVLLIQLYNQR